MPLTESAENLLARIVARHILYSGGACTMFSPTTRVKVDFDPNRSSALQREEVTAELEELAEEGFIKARRETVLKDGEWEWATVGHDLTEAGVLHFLKPEMSLVVEKEM
jgi:hypothetical protein